MEASEHNLRSIQEVPPAYRSVFGQYPCFNVVQSAVFDEAMKTDNSLVVSAPTGSGKTAIFEMAIIRHLLLAKESPNVTHQKIIYISPIKALCKERLIDWHKKFSEFGLSCISATSDSDHLDIKHIAQCNLIISTPEKWDVLTRRWREFQGLIGSISLFLVDEVHLLNADTRGSTLEVIVNRMKTAVMSMISYQEKSSIRFIALSATIPNIEDIAEWIGPSETTKYFKFSEDVRPVRLNKIVIGYYFNPQNQTNFKFDMSLSYKLSGLITRYSEGKPTLIFCNTRKSVEMTASHLVSNLQIHLSPDQKEILFNISRQLNDSKLRQYIVHGIAFHHAGLVQDNRYNIEESFRKGYLPVLVTTSTLAMGVNLPAHLVIVKSTKCYTDSGYKDYDEVSIFQMIGRAGRSQFDSSATALILTSTQDKEKYEQMLGCTQTIESNLHKHLTEHLNAEVVLRTITDLDVAMRWLSSTFLYVRARRSPEKYKLPVGLSKEKIDQKLLAMCQIDLNKLVRAGMIKMNEDIEISPTVVGEIMAKYYVAFDTMKLFTQISGNEILIQILAIISKCKEFSEIYLRTNDKRCLNMLNKNSNKESNRFRLTGRIKTVDMKVNCIIQAVLGNLEIHDQSILCDSIKIMRSCERLANCLIEYLQTRDNCFSAMLNTVILAKCFRVKLWENSPYVSKQLTGVGRVMSTLLMKAGKTSFKEIASTNPRHIEMIVGRKAPFGNNIVAEASHLPEYSISLENQTESAELVVTLLNPKAIEKESTMSLDSTMTLLVGDSNNNILLYEKYTHVYFLNNPKLRRCINIESQDLEFLKADLISENWVGIDCCCKLELISCRQPAPDANQGKNRKQTFMEAYLKHAKKSNAYKKKDEVKVRSNENCSGAKKNVNQEKINTPKGIPSGIIPENNTLEHGIKVHSKENCSGVKKNVNQEKINMAKGIPKNNASEHEIKVHSEESSNGVNRNVNPKKNHMAKGIPEKNSLVKGDLNGHEASDSMAQVQAELFLKECEINNDHVIELEPANEQNVFIIEDKTSKNNQKSSKAPKNPKKEKIKVSKSIFHTATKSKPEKKKKDKAKSKNEDLDDFLSESQTQLIMEEFMRDDRNAMEAEDVCFDTNFSQFAQKYDEPLNKIKTSNHLADQSEGGNQETNTSIMNPKHHCTPASKNTYNNASTSQGKISVPSANHMGESEDVCDNLGEKSASECFTYVNATSPERNSSSPEGEYKLLTKNTATNNENPESINFMENEIRKIRGRDDEVINTQLSILKKYTSSMKFDDQAAECDKAAEAAMPNEDKSQRNMDYPDSTAGFGMFQTADFFSPQKKRQKKDEGYGASFELFPPRSVKWRSPLVHTATENSSHNRPLIGYNSEENRFENNNNNKEDPRESTELHGGGGTQNTSTTTSSMFSNPFENSEKQQNVANTPSVKTSTRTKTKFPLSDQDWTNDENESFNKKIQLLNSICDLEELGFTNNSNKKKESPAKASAWSKAHAGKYYNQLIMNSQAKKDRNDPKNSQQINRSNYSQSKLEDVREETQRDFQASMKNLQLPEPPSVQEPEGNIQSEQLPGHARYYQDMYSFTQPAPMEYHRNHPNIPFPERKFIGHAHPVNEAMSEPGNYLNSTVQNTPFRLSAQRRFVNPYLYEQGYQTSPYFSHQRRPEIMPRFPMPYTQGAHSCRCYSHHPPRYLGMNPYYNLYSQPMAQSGSCCSHMDYRHPHSSGMVYRPHVSDITDIPEEYNIDQCLQELDEQPVRCVPRPSSDNFDRNTTSFSGADRANGSNLFNLYEKENMHPEQRFRENHNNFHVGEASSYAPICEDVVKDSGNRSLKITQELQTPKPNVSQIFAARPKRGLTHGPSAFTQKPMIPTSAHHRASMPPSEARRMMDFSSFEERLDNMIQPSRQAFSFPATRDRDLRFDPSARYNGNVYQN